MRDIPKNGCEGDYDKFRSLPPPSPNQWSENGAFWLFWKLHYWLWRKGGLTCYSIYYFQDCNCSKVELPWVPETFLARFPVSVKLRRSGIRPTAEDVSAFSQHRNFPLHARKTSGTQGKVERAFLCAVRQGWEKFLSFLRGGCKEWKKFETRKYWRWIYYYRLATPK